MVTINLPSLMHGVVDAYDTERCVGVETASLDARLTESLLGLALSLASNGQEVGFLTANMPRVLYLVEEWTGTKTRALGAFRRITLDGGGSLWLSASAESETPYSRLDRLFVDGADSWAKKPLVLRSRKLPKLVIGGRFTSKGHWFYEWCREKGTTLCRWTADDITEVYPDELESIDTNAPGYRRDMLLEDIEVDHRRPFLRYSSERLRVKTDKDARFLSPLQQEAALGQFGQPIVPFVPSSLQRRYLAIKRYWKARGRSNFLLLKYRRGGFTTLEQAESYAFCDQNPRSSCTTLAHNLQSTQRIFRIAKTLYEEDPEQPKLAGDSRSMFEFADNGSIFFIGTAGSKGFSRGDTLQRVHGSEVSKWLRGPNQINQVNDLIAGLVGAASMGEVCLETTPDGHEWFYNTYKAAKRGDNDWVPIFLPWFADRANTANSFSMEEMLDTITEDEKRFMSKNGIDYAQLAWRREQQRLYGVLFGQEYPEDDEACFISTGHCYFDLDAIAHHRNKLDREPILVKHLPGGNETRWYAPQKGVKYIAGVDTSEGVPGGDSNGIGIIRQDTGQQVASIHGLFSVREQGENAVRLCREYNDALLGLERENHGHAVLEVVKTLGYDKPHYTGGSLFYYTKGRAGWTTSSLTRPVMLAELAEALESDLIEVNDELLLSEAVTFRKQPSGKYEHDPSAHDDSIFKWGIAWQMRKERRSAPSMSFM